MKARNKVVGETIKSAGVMARNLSINQRSALDRKSLECDSMLIRSAGHLDKFTFPILKQ